MHLQSDLAVALSSSRKGNLSESYGFRHCFTLTRPAIDRYVASARTGLGGEGQERPSGCTAGLCADFVSAVSQADEAQSGALEVGRPGPFCAVEWACVSAALWNSVSDGLQADTGRFEELSAVGIDYAGSSGVRVDRWSGGDNG